MKKQKVYKLFYITTKMAILKMSQEERELYLKQITEIPVSNGKKDNT